METNAATVTEPELRLWTRTVLIVVFCLEAAGCVLMPPQNVTVYGSQLTWAPGSGDGEVLYTVEYQRHASKSWQQVLACTLTPHTSCDFSSAKAEAEHGCVALHVRAHEHGVSSAAVPACSSQGGPCSPEVTLTAAPGAIMVNLNKKHNLHDEYADSACYRISFGKEGEKLNVTVDTLSSETFSNLEEGQRYCAAVEFMLYGKPIGVPSCVRCELIPSQSTTKKTVIITSVVVGVIVLVIVPVIFYLLTFQRTKIKKLLKPYEIVNLLPDLPAQSEHRDLLPPPCEEPCDVISSMVPADSSGLS
ncbi:Interferon alpha/beta receptor 1 [Oryzias melastigma]|uniref:Interferon alpha/beta receptor 1 n=1 Tax=Oryzias melastigma TaxID=30732 RepID=A0A3B3CF32_ORYME|nr:interferon gamma receptor 2 [Oryzias melastigma]KAF6718630.1 Interferon alpha/beta receptor 1 [Oryzias melastigma]